VGQAQRRGSWRGFALLALAGAGLVAPCGERGGPAGAPSAEAPGVRLQARVLEVIDGDTIEVELAGGAVESVRYIGIDTPESTPDQPLECFGHEAAEANAGLVGNRTVELALGAEVRDDYGRLLAYVVVPGAPPSMANAELLAGGYARTLTIAPNDARAPEFARLEANAARVGRGLWSACNR
jgi:micrococcal nuclease